MINNHLHLGWSISARQKNKPPSFKARLFRSGPCLLCIALFFILIALIFLLSAEYSYNGYGFGDDAVIVYNGTEIWPTRWFAYSLVGYFDKPHVFDLYAVPVSDLKEYQQLETYQDNGTFYANITYSAGTINGVYLKNGTIVHYNITASSSNLTTTDGQLMLFTTQGIYHDCISCEFPYELNYPAFFNYSIGADNRPLMTNFSVKIDTTSYYYFVCMVPANSEFSFSASVDVLRYNYSVNSEKLVTVEPNADKSFYIPSMKEPTIILAYIRPNVTAGRRSSVQIYVNYYRLLPSSSLLMLVGVTLFVTIFAVLLYNVM